MEPAVKLSREIIQELREDISALQENIGTLQEDNSALQKNISTLQESNSALQENNSILHQKTETGCRNLVIRQQKEGRSIAETVDALMEIFLLTEEEASRKAELYWEAGQN